MTDIFERTRWLIGDEGIERLKHAHIAVFGIGGVGGYAVEALVRSGIGCLTLIDNDTINISNLNRQIIATQDTVGQLKTKVMEARIHSIHPETKVETRECFFLPENSGEISFEPFDYIIDAVDTVTAKLEIICKAKAAGVPVISSMGTGNKLEPGKLAVTDIYKTSGCPLARIMRRELKKRRIASLKVVYSTEKPLKPRKPSQNLSDDRRRDVPGSAAFVPPSAGLMMASEVVRDLLSEVASCPFVSN